MKKINDIIDNGEVAVAKNKFDVEKVKKFLLGTNNKKGFLAKAVCYALLILFGFVYLYPMLYMLSYSLMSPADVIDPSIQYIPSQLYFGNYLDAAQVLDFWNSLLQSMLVAVLPSILQTVSTALIAYALARFSFKGKGVLVGLVLATFVIPPQITLIPQVIMYAQVGLSNNILTYLIPAALGQGLKSAVFVIIFYQYFRSIPKSLEEAAEIDGANSFTIFIKVAVPIAMPAVLLSLLLSFVWYFNETSMATLLLGGSFKTLPLQLERFKAAYDAMFGGTSAETGKSINEAIYMAGTTLSILPLLIMYFFTQKLFIQGVDKAGITGE